MPTLRIRTSRVKPVCTWHLDRPPEGPSPGLLTIAVGKQMDHYFLYPLASDFGTAFRLDKFRTLGGEVYHVLLNGPASSCECLGFLRWNNCKHIRACAGIAAARRRGGPSCSS